MSNILPSFTARTVIRSLQFEQAASEIAHDIQRMDSVLEGVEWALARYHGNGQVILETVALAEIPAFAVIARISHDDVELIDISRLE